MLQRTALSFARRGVARQSIARSFATRPILRKDAPLPTSEKGGEAGIVSHEDQYVKLEDIRSEHDLLAPGAKEGTVPSDYEQSTGLERLEILGKMEGVDIFDMKPLDASRLGTLDDPIIVKSAGDEQYCGCTGFPADSHNTIWLTTSRKRPIERCPECGSVYKMEYIGPPDEPDHHHHGWEEPKTIIDYLEPKYLRWGAKS